MQVANSDWSTRVRLVLNRPLCRHNDALYTGNIIYGWERAVRGENLTCISYNVLPAQTAERRFSSDRWEI